MYIYIFDETGKNKISYIIKCPHCEQELQIFNNEINCKIFRCGIYKDSFQPINPHASKKECDLLFSEQKIYGCSKPFKFDGKNVSKCDYI